MTIGEVIYRIKRLVKGVKQDAFLTDRFIYSLLQKHVKLILKRQDSKNNVLRINSFFTTLSCVELINVTRVEGFEGLDGCTIMRTKNKLPSIVNGYWGPLIKNVTSIDGFMKVHQTTPSQFRSKQRNSLSRYDSNKYYWYSNGYLYFPNIEWESVSIEALFEFDPSCDNSDQCTLMQDQPYNVPDDIHSELESLVLRDLLGAAQIPVDTNKEDTNNILR